MIVSTILFLLVLAAKLWYDYREWKKHRAINHREIWIAMVLCVPIALMMANYSEANFVISLVLTPIAMACFWMPAFNITYNLIRRYKPFFTGSEDGKDDSKVDNFFQSLKPIKVWVITISPVVQHAAIELSCLAISLFIYLKILN